MHKPLVVIVGPTASGKSALAMQVAQKYNGEIVCADSRTVYTGMDIGTAKPTPADQQKVKHHLIDVVYPDQPFTAAQFKQLANQAIADIRRRGRLPLLVGGTGLYADAVIFDYEFGASANQERRAELMGCTIEKLQAICSDNNIKLPVNDQNKRHLVRAIELGGLTTPNRQLIPNCIVVGIATERDLLRPVVEARAQQMFNSGVIDEAKALATTYGWNHESMTAGIYRVLRGVIDGTITREQAIQYVIRSDMSLAKRQVTWFKRNQYIKWGSPVELLNLIDQALRVVKN